ncbi:unnamed protein product [Cylicocyclus nassatus]|uniref:Uncharacterized protein n=1 Tax=Cylicocyclus nassatus TaxID=53992 RepID=A0AA36M868_CYLNA|nr:unnamed protein product [Cylicocyclus nassatus]
MHRCTETTSEKRNRYIKNFEHLSKALQISKAVQTRYQLIPQSALNKVVVAGIRDTKLMSATSDGFVIRVNNPSMKSPYNRICIDPNGVPSKFNTHIPVSETVVQAAAKIQKGVQVAGKALFVVSILASGYRVINTIQDELDIDSQIEAYEKIVSCLKEDLENCNEEERTEKKKALDFAMSLLEDARDCKRNPGKKTILTSLCIGGEWGGAAALGYAGAQGGAAIGAFGGPLLGLAGAVTGGVLGGVAGTELGASAIENFRCDEDGIASEAKGSLMSFGENSRVAAVNASFFAGKGLEVGASAGIFQKKGDDGSLDVGKIGADFGISNKGLDARVEIKPYWCEVEEDKYKYATGLNLDTGFQWSKDRAELSVFGFGLSKGTEGLSIKLPVFNFTWKY